MRTISRLAVVVVLVVLLRPGVVHAFTACNQVDAFPLCDNANGKPCHWPDSRNTVPFGTQKWEFDWQVSGQGVEIYNVKYTADLTQPKKLVMKRGSLPMLPVHYPDGGLSCPNGVIGTGGGHGYSDLVSILDSSHNFCCAHVPTTPCYEPDRAGVCEEYVLTSMSSCPGGTTSCNGVCLGTQFDLTAPIEDGSGETVSGDPTADVVIGATFIFGTYQFINRWRFRDDGTLLPSMRMGSIWQCQLHTHQVYWRLDFDLVDASQSEVIQQCDSGGCPDTGSTGWSSNLGCSCADRPDPNTWWRVSDTNLGSRQIIIQSGVNEGVASTFCQGTQAECASAGGCFNSRDFCALPSPDDSMNFVAYNCDDHLKPDGPHAADWSGACSGFSGGRNTAFWYFGHVDNHDPCAYTPICDPKPGAGDPAGVGFGPTIRLVGSW